jgi:hypothetical protein
MRRSYLPYGLTAILFCLVVMLSVDGATAQSPKFEAFPDAFPKAGDTAPDFTLKTVDGDTFTLSEAYAEQPVVIEFGSYT